MNVTRGSVGEDATVLIVGAGPAGLVLGNLLLSEGIDCLIVERSSRDHVEHRARAGFLVANTVRVLRDNGLAEGLLARGQTHSTCFFRDENHHFELNYGALGRHETHTVYPQQDLVKDLIASFVERGGRIRFDTLVVEVHDVRSDRPRITCRDAEGARHQLTGRYVAGCDGRHGASRRAIPEAAARRYRADHGVFWLAVLAAAPQSMSAVTYAVHEDGFAGHMARGPAVTRYYLQCEPRDSPERWPATYVWQELSRRMRAERHGPLHQGPIIEQRVVELRSDVIEPIQYGRLFLAGDSASLISPMGAKGANLAVMESETLAHALIAMVQRGDEAPLARYSADCLPRIWRAQEFSHWMLGLLHGPPGQGDDARFRRALQRSRLERLRESRAHQDWFAQEYVGI